MDLDKLFNEAARLYDNWELNEAFKLYLKGAVAGHTPCMVAVALMYSDGDGVEQNYKKSIEWDTKAHEAGHYSSIRNKAITYRMMGRLLDYRYWLEQALDAGEGEAALDLAKLYMISDKEEETVRKYLELAVSHEDMFEVSIEEAEKLLEKLNKT